MVYVFGRRGVRAWAGSGFHRRPLLALRRALRREGSSAEAAWGGQGERAAAPHKRHDPAGGSELRLGRDLDIRPRRQGSRALSRTPPTRRRASWFAGTLDLTGSGLATTCG